MRDTKTKIQKLHSEYRRFYWLKILVNKLKKILGI